MDGQIQSGPKFMTLERHIIEGEREHPGATGSFTSLLRNLSLAAKLIWREVTKAGLVNILGKTDRMNISGDVIKKLAEFADQTIYKAMDHGGDLCVMASEENEDILQIPDDYPHGRYVLIYDPLDGSGNIDANVTIGTIFSVYARVTESGMGTIEDVLQPGHRQVAAGYLLFGSSMMFVYCTGHGVHGFTLDPSVGEFILSHENIRIPRTGTIYSTNEGNFDRWTPNMQRYMRCSRRRTRRRGARPARATSARSWPTCTAQCFTGGSTAIRGTARTRTGSSVSCTRTTLSRSSSRTLAVRLQTGGGAYWTSSRHRFTSVSPCISAARMTSVRRKNFWPG